MDTSQEGSRLTVSIAHRTVFLVLALIFLATLSAKLTNVLIVIFLAILIATAMSRPITWFERRGIPRSGGALLLFGIVVLIIAGIILLLIPAVKSELTVLRANLPKILRDAQNALNRSTPQDGASSDFTITSLTSKLTAHIDTLASRLTSMTFQVGQVLLLAFAMLVIAFFLAVDDTQIPRLVERLLEPPKAERVNSVIAGIQVRIGGWVEGQIIIAVSFGILMGIGFWLIGIPYAATLGALAAILELVPYLGGAVTVVLASLMALPLGWGHVAAVVVLYAILITLESHVAAPLLYGHAVGLPSVAILIALLIGVELIGVLGALLAVPSAVIVWAIIEEIWPDPRPKKRRRVLLPAAIKRRVARHGEFAPSGPSLATRSDELSVDTGRRK